MSQLAQQMRHRDREMVPRVLVRSMFALMLATLALVSAAVLSDRPHEGVIEQSPVAEEIVVTLSGSRNGPVDVIAEDGSVIANSEEERAGFIAVIWRTIERERMRRAAAPGPVRVVRRENGRIAVIDPETGWSVDLIGYGRDNVAAFARLLEDT